jgi:lysophospholipase L1-like esterase
MTDLHDFRRVGVVIVLILLVSVVCWLGGYFSLFSGSGTVLKIVMIGDSNTHSERNYTYDGLGNGYVRLISERLAKMKRPDQPDFVVINRGVRGDGIGDLVKRWRRDVILEKPDVLSVAIGINDATGKRLTNEEFEKTYRALLQQARQANSELKVILMEVFLVGNGPERLSQEDLQDLKNDVTSKNTIIRAVGREIGARIVPLEDLLRENPDHDSDFRPEIDDGIHISRRGHQRIADAWLVSFQE